MAERNRGNREELKLILCELRDRSTATALQLRERVGVWIGECDGPFTTGAASMPETKNSKANPENEVEEPPLASSRPNPQADQWIFQAVTKLPAKLIDLGRRSPLIWFKHTSRIARQLRSVYERTALLFERRMKAA